MIEGLGQCGTIPNYYRRATLCRPPFDAWKSFVSDRVERDCADAALPT